jgi:hypothetical protein
MPNTIRTEGELLILFADNAVGGISAQDLRDFVVSIYANGGGGTPGGVNAQIQYNNAGAFGGSVLRFNSGNNSFQVNSGGDVRGEFAVDFQAIRDPNVPEGETQVASGYASFIASGKFNIASGPYSHVSGKSNTASGEYATAEGVSCIASGYCSHAEGSTTIASGYFSHAEGNNATASGYCSHAEGSTTIASSNYSHAEGNETTASGNFSHAEGKSTTASGYYSHAEGRDSTASGNTSHAEGLNTTAGPGNFTHAEGNATTASGQNSHAEGNTTTASGDQSHAEGQESTASGTYSHAGGHRSVASLWGQFSRASGAFDDDGIAQYSFFTLFRYTTDDTETPLTLNGGSPTGVNRLTIPTNTLFHAWIHIAAHSEGSSGYALFSRYCGIINNGTTTSLVGAVEDIGTDKGNNAGVPPVGWAIAITADNSNDALIISVTGTDSLGINWVAKVETVEVAVAEATV